MGLHSQPLMLMVELSNHFLCILKLHDYLFFERLSLIIPKIIQDSLGEYNLQERSVDYIVIDSKDQKVGKLKEDLLKKYYEDNKTNFMSDERRSSETLLLDAKKYATKLTVTDEEVKLLFEERKELLKEPEQRYIQQILVDSKEKAEKMAKDAAA